MSNYNIFLFINIELHFQHISLTLSLAFSPPALTSPHYLPSYPVSQPFFPPRTPSTTIWCGSFGGTLQALWYPSGTIKTNHHSLVVYFTGN